jgi:PAS domain S-box-containing protein
MPTVYLDGFPVQLFHAMHDVTEDLIRDYQLTAMNADEPFTLADIALARQAKHWVAAAADHQPDGVTLQLDLAMDQVAAFPVLQAVLDHANRLAREERLLVPPVLPEVAALRNWLCDQVVGQPRGAQRQSWRLPDTLEQPSRTPATWPQLSILPPGEAWLVGDDSNRIIGASPAALELLGWESLVGERILAVIPPAFRERHVAAFTRSLVRDEYPQLGKPLAVRALRSDGTEIDITLTLSRHEAEDARTVFLAQLNPSG